MLGFSFLDRLHRSVVAIAGPLCFLGGEELLSCPTVMATRYFSRAAVAALAVLHCD